MGYQKGDCVKIARKDSVFKLKQWEVDRIKNEKDSSGKEKEVIFLKNKSVKKPLQVNEDWLDRNTKKVKCK
jgi:hypothetical protein